MKKRTGLKIGLLAVSLAAVVFTAYGLVSELMSSRQSEEYFSSLAANTKQRVKTPAVSSSPPPETEPQSGETPAGEEPVWEPFLDFNALLEQIPDLTAWLQIEGTTVDYPVVSGEDNEYYLKHLPNGESNKTGSIFLDYRNSPGFSDANTVIYGHHMKNGSMFGTLERYKEQAFYEAHPVINIYTPTADYSAELIAGYVISGQTGTLPLSFKDAASFEDYISTIRENSVFQSKVTAAPGDKLLTLCTCTYNFSNARLVLVARLTELS